MALAGQTSVTGVAVPVWDWPLRIFHWLLVICVAGSWATHYAGIEWFDWHRRCGYTVLVLVAFRIVWGFAGPHYARFANFVRGPATIVTYLRSLRSARDIGIAGHNPAGALSVVAFLVALLFQATTGLLANDEIANAGPFYGWISQATSNRVTGWHEINSKILLALIVLHLLVVAWYDLGLRAGLTRAMVSGRKRLPAAAIARGIDDSRPWRAFIIVLLLAGALAVAIRAAPEATVALF